MLGRPLRRLRLAAGVERRTALRERLVRPARRRHARLQPMDCRRQRFQGSVTGRHRRAPSPMWATSAACAPTAQSHAGGPTLPDPSAPAGGTFTQTSDLCGITTGGEIVCWGTGQYGRANRPEQAPPGRYVQISAGGFHACGLRTDGSVRCWGSGYGSGPAPPAEAFAQVSVGATHPCGVTTGGRLECWDRRYWGPAPDCGGLAGARAFRASRGPVRAGFGGRGPLRRQRRLRTARRRCPRLLRLQRTGRRARRQLPRRVGRAPPDLRAAHRRHHRMLGLARRRPGAARARTGTGSRRCRPPAATHAVSASTAASPVGATTTTGPLTLPPGPTPGSRSATAGPAPSAPTPGWSAGAGGPTPSPNGGCELLPTRRRARSPRPRPRSSYACGLTTAGGIECWGAGTLGRADPPEGPFTQISVGPSYACGVHHEGEVKCWG